MRERAGALASVIMVTTAEDAARAELLGELARHEISCVRLQVIAAATTAVLPRLEQRVHTFAIRADHIGDDLARVSLR